MSFVTVTFNATLNTPSSNFVAALYDPSTGPITLLEQQLVPKSGGVYITPFNVAFTTNLTQGKIYRVILWETSGTTVGGVSRISTDFDGSVNSVSTLSPLYLTTDTSAGLVSGTNTYVNATLIGWGIVLDIPGSDTAFPGSDYTYDSTTGTITYLLGNWAPGQRIVIFPQPKIGAAPAPAITAIQSGTIITASRSLTNADKNKALFVQATGSSINCPLPALSTLSDYDHIVLYSNAGNHINAVFPTAGADIIQWYKTGTALVQIILGQGEKLDLFKANGTWNVDYASSGILRVGELIYRYTKGDLNTIFADGSLLLRSQYPRLFAYVQALQAAGSPAIVAEASWNAATVLDSVAYRLNNGCYTMGDGSTTFRIPLLYSIGSSGAGFLRGVDGLGGAGSRGAGSGQFDSIPLHQHESLTGEYPPTGPGTPGPFGRGLRSVSGGYNGLPGVVNDLGGTPGVVVGGAFQIAQRLVFENRPANVGAYISICI